jgi:hypothetical protein
MENKGIYKMKYLKYNKKNKMSGGLLRITYNYGNVMILQAIYSYCHLLSGSIIDKSKSADSTCKIKPNYNNCTILKSLKIPMQSTFFPKKSREIDVRILIDELNNNLVLCFSPNLYLPCEYISNELIDKFFELYDTIIEIFQSREFQFIHFVGHSQGMSCCTMFAYFIMIIEDNNINITTTDKIFTNDQIYDLNDIKFTHTYDDHHTDLNKLKNNEGMIDFLSMENYNIPSYDLERKIMYISRDEEEIRFLISENEEISLQQISNYKNIFLNNMRDKINKKIEQYRNNTVKLNEKIFICGGGGFPVLFKTADEFLYFITFYKKKYRNYMNFTMSQNNRKIYDAYMFNVDGINVYNFFTHDIQAPSRSIDMGNFPKNTIVKDEILFFGNTLDNRKIIDYLELVHSYSLYRKKFLNRMETFGEEIELFTLHYTNDT